ncbi:MAG: hypothetical protein HYX94_01755 [Chloroflexi bacterium]|nr:hypothetical protein [Chloroflexota bacterium]
MLSTPDPALALPVPRTDHWLETELNFLWESFFPDIPIVNQVEISFARPWKSRLGLIRLSESGSHTYIGINRLLSDLQVPSQVISITIAHELVHYSHGFGSPLPRKYKHPHCGAIVPRELASRGLTAELQVFKEWTSRHWYSFYFSIVPQRDNGRSGGRFWRYESRERGRFGDSA